MDYEELKKTINDKLIESGFELSNTTLNNEEVDVLIKTETHRNQIIINGTPSIQEEKHTLNFICLGEGAIDDYPLVGYKLKADKQDLGDFWLSEVNDLKTFFNIQ